MTNPTYGANEHQPHELGAAANAAAGSSHDAAGPGPAEPAQAQSHGADSDEPAEPAEAAEQGEPAEPADPDEPADPGEPGEPADPVAAAQAERDQYLELLRRERAEFENYRKRASKERSEALDRGAEQVCSELLLVLDNFDYTHQAAEGSSDDQLAKGVEMVHRQLLETLERFGLEAVPGEGATFDPTVHEAVAQVEAEQELGEAVEEPVVVEVMRPGYRFKDRLLRPASVKVAK
jgi:molecular chaperone GrpE